MTKGKLGLHVYVGTLLVLAKASERDYDDCAIRIEDDEARVNRAVRRVQLQTWRRPGYLT